MDVRLSAEQQALRDSVAQVVDRLGPHAVGQLDDAERAAKLDAAIEASGWRELRAAAEGDSPLASGVEAAIVAEQLGRGLADAPYVGPTLAADLRRLVGAPPSTGAETVGLEPDLTELACVPADGPRRGPLVAVDAGAAERVLVMIPAPGGHRVGELAPARTAEPVDLTRPTAGADGPPRELRGQHRILSDDDVTRWTALGLALTSADLVGVMQGAVDLGCEYAAQREQYGTTIGSFQAVQHLLADALVATEGSRSATLHAAWAVDALPAADALAAGAVAKAYSARAARTVCEAVIQVHGGIGNTWECLAHVFLRRALVSTDTLGGAGANLARVLDHHGIGGTDGLR